MWTCFQWNRRWHCWPVMIRRALVPSVVLALGGCAMLPGGGESELQAGLRAELASEPAARVPTTVRRTWPGSRPMSKGSALISKP